MEKSRVRLGNREAARRENGDERTQELLAWIQSDLELEVKSWEPVAGDASSRRYFRVLTPDRSWIVMDAPSDRTLPHFVAVAELLRDAGIRVPQIHARRIDEGFLLLEDFGDTTYFRALDRDRVEKLYGEALTALFRLQTRIDPGDCDLPPYDDSLLRRELEIFRDWLLTRWLEVSVPEAIWHSTVEGLVASALEQPRVCVHRDYHSRNLMVLPGHGPGVLDFQDAVVGPVTYDVVSLLRDCYLAWPGPQVARWRENYRQRLATVGIDVSPPQWRRWFDRMGAQRHLKAAGIFARLWLRDGRSGYLKEIPRTLGYIVDVGREDKELQALGDYLKREILPRVGQRMGP